MPAICIFLFLAHPPRSLLRGQPGTVHTHPKSAQLGTQCHDDDEDDRRAGMNIFSGGDRRLPPYLAKFLWQTR